MMFSRPTFAVLATFSLGLTLCTGAFACSTDGWDDVVGAVAVGQPFGSDLGAGEVDGVSRFQELCAMRVNGAGHVQTNAPSHGRVRARLYFFANLESLGAETVAGVNLVVAHSDEVGGDELFHIAWDGGEVIVDATANGGSQDQATGISGWNWAEVDWDPATDSMDVWLNSDATVDLPTFTVTTGSDATTMESMLVGAPTGLGSYTGNLFFDAVQLHNETAIGPEENCDANADTDFNVFDLLEAIDEINEIDLSVGTPDCDFSGLAINVFDLLAMIEVINSP